MLMLTLITATSQVSGKWAFSAPETLWPWTNFVDIWHV